MTWLDVVPWGLTGIASLAGFVGIWYYRSRYGDAQQTIQALTGADARWAAQNDLQAKQLAAAEAALTARQTEERKNDQDTAKRASGDVNLASNLLNGLHQNPSGSSASSPANLSSSSGSPIPGVEKSALR